MTNVDIRFNIIPNEIYKFNEKHLCRLCNANLTLDKECISWAGYNNTFAYCSLDQHYNISYEWEDPKKVSVADHFFAVEDDNFRYTLKIAFNNNGIINELTCHNINTDKTEHMMMSGKLFHLTKKVNEKNLLKKLKMIWTFQ